MRFPTSGCPRFAASPARSIFKRTPACARPLCALPLAHDEIATDDRNDCQSDNRTARSSARDKIWHAPTRRSAQLPAGLRPLPRVRAPLSHFCALLQALAAILFAPFVSRRTALVQPAWAGLSLDTEQIVYSCASISTPFGVTSQQSAHAKPKLPGHCSATIGSVGRWPEPRQRPTFSLAPSEEV